MRLNTASPQVIGSMPSSSGTALGLLIGGWFYSGVFGVDPGEEDQHVEEYSYIYSGGH
jgi:hypothetical protein